jgi:4-alpha-glucanotransferase
MNHNRIATLGRLCGIAPEYVDNYGVCRPTALATYQSLLTAMGMAWEDSEQASREIARLRLRPWSGLVDGLTVVFCDSERPRLVISPWTPAGDLPALRVSGTIRDEQGRASAWETVLSASPLTRLAVEDHLLGPGFRSRLELPLPGELQPGYYDLKLEVELGDASRRQRGETRLIVAPGQAYLPPALARGQKLWGLNLPLYALKSGRNWGMGDFTDLQEALAWAGELGAAFVGVNPLHARRPGDQIDSSPYSPSTRIFRDFLYLDPEAAPEFRECRAVQDLWAAPATRDLLNGARHADLVDYDRVYRLKRQVLELLYQKFLERHGSPEHPLTGRGREFAGFVAAGGLPLQRFGQYNALADHLGAGDWQTWPREYQHPETEAVEAFSSRQREAIHRHLYWQWLTAGQLEAAQNQARARGLPFTLYQDLALGAAAGGAETWAHPGLFAKGTDLGAPPDAFNPGGQNWGLPPLIPERLRQDGYRLFIDTLRANLPPDGMLRLDHVMGLFRLFWIPRGRSAAAGAYVHYPAREMLGILALESRRRRTLIIGEDLGTVPPRVRRELARQSVLSYRVFYFERSGDGNFKDPEDYPPVAVAAVTTHDLPTLAGYWQGEDIRLKNALGLFPQTHLAAEGTAARERDRERLLKITGATGVESAGKGLAEASAEACPEEVRFGVLEYLARSRAALMEVRLEEIFGAPEQQNLPGTTTQYPNWRRKLPLTLEEMRRNPAAARLAARLRKYRGKDSNK